jgi:hypothetical protein
MLSVGPGARQFSPSEGIPIGNKPHFGNVHYRQPPGYRLEIKTSGGLTKRSWDHAWESRCDCLPGKGDEER